MLIYKFLNFNVDWKKKFNNFKYEPISRTYAKSWYWFCLNNFLIFFNNFNKSNNTWKTLTMAWRFIGYPLSIFFQNFHRPWNYLFNFQLNPEILEPIFWGYFFILSTSACHFLFSFSFLREINLENFFLEISKIWGPTVRYT